MKKFTVNAYSLEEAKQLAVENGITVIKNVTQSWKHADSPFDGKALEVFCTDTLSKNNLVGAKGTGLIVAANPGSKDTRERPYKFENVVSEGKRKTKRTFEIRLVKTDEVVGSANKKADAEKLAKELMKEYAQDMYAVIIHKVTEGKDVAFKLKYTPSASAKKGTYIVFGTEPSSF